MFMSDILPSLIGAGSGLLSGVGSIFAQNSANKANMKLQQQQQAYDTQMWNMQNAYNDPSAQMARTSAAGINPFQAMGSSGVSVTSGNNSSPAQGVAPAHVDALPVGGVLMSALSGFLNTLTAQSQSIKAVADAAAQDRSRFLLPGQIRLQDSDFKTNLSQQGALNAAAGLSDQQAANLKQENDFRVFTNSLYQKYGDKLTALQVGKLAAECKNIVADTKLKKAQYNLTDEQVRTEVSKQVANYAAANHMNVDSQSIAMHIVPDIVNENADTQESLSRTDVNHARASNIRNDTYNHNQDDWSKSFMNAATGQNVS